MIKIFPRGVPSNSDAKQYLSNSAPYAYNNAQRIIMVTRKCAKPPGLFSNPVRHLPDLDEACESLCAAIAVQGLKNDVGSLMSPSEVMSIFSDAHHGWQKEYDWLNRNCPFFSEEFSIDEYLLTIQT